MKKRQVSYSESNKQKEEELAIQTSDNPADSSISSPSKNPSQRKFSNNTKSPKTQKKKNSIDQQKKEMKESLNNTANGQQVRHKSFFQVFLLVLVASFGSLYFGYALGVMSLAQKTIFKVFNVSSDQESMYSSLLSASIPFGAMIGAISAGKLLDLVSRKNAFIVADIIGVATTLLSQITNIQLLVVSRVIAGIVTGLNSALVPQYIQEVSPSTISGIMGTVFSMCINTGIIIGSLNGQFFDENPTSSDSYWRFVFLFPLILTVTRTIFLFIFYNHETPFYYLLKNDEDSCNKFLQKIYKPEYVDEVQSEIQQQVDKTKLSSEGYSDMFKPQYRKRLLIGCTLQIFQQFSGINAVIMYSGQIFEKNDYDFTLTNLLSLISNVVLLIAAFASGFFVNSLGRRSILIYGSALSGAFQLGLSILSKIDNKEISYLSVIFIFCYYLAFNFSLGPIVWLYCSEILPEKGISIATMCNWIGATIIVLVLPYISQLWILFIFYASICFVCVVFTVFCVNETKGKSKMEIANMYLPKDSEEYKNLSTYSSDKEKYVQ